MASNHPSPRTRRVGAELRGHREAAKFTVRGLAEKLGIAHATLSRYETGARTPGPDEVEAILEACGVAAPDIEEIVALARGADGSAWLAVSVPDQRQQLAALLEFEREAVRLTNVSPLLWPGLLQAADYTRAIMARGGVPADEIDTRVAIRVGRREVLTRRNPAQLLALVGEPALGAVIGGPRVMLDQLRHVLKIAKLPTVDLRVVPTAVDWHPAMEGMFVFAELEDGSSVVHLETRASGLFLHEKTDVAKYEAAVDKVLDEAMSPERSVGLITRVAERIEETIAGGDDI